MATIPREALDYVTREVNGVSAQAQQQVMRVLERIDWTDVEKARELVVQAVQMALSNATTLAAQASADLYDAVREASIGSALGAQPISGYEPEKTEKAVRSFVRFIVDGRPETFDDQVLQRIDYEIKRSAGYCITENGALDPTKPRYARVPTGAETCSFCIMLASRGFVYHSKSSAGAVNHYHANCDCRVIPAWGTYADGVSRRSSNATEIEGYDPDAYYDEYMKMIESGELDREALAKSASKRVKGSTSAAKKFSGGLGEMKSYLDSAKGLDELYARSDELVKIVTELYPDNKSRRSEWISSLSKTAIAKRNELNR